MHVHYLTRAAGAGAGLFALYFAMLPATALAQESALEEITVTAQKREQSALDVPVTVDVFTARDIEGTGAINLQEIQDFIPGFEMGANPTQSSITIRGVSSANISTGGDPSVATFYDDIYVPRAATTGAFTDVARIEVLKGPQGTLYGRNTAAGVVNVVPNRPAAENTGFLKTRLGNYDLRRLEGMVNAVLTENLFVRANFLSNRRDGYIANLVRSERDPGQQDNLAGRIAVLWEASDSTDLQVSWDIDQLDNAPRPAIGLSEWAACPDNPRCGAVLNDVVNGEESRHMWAANVKLTHEFSDEWSTKLVHGYRTFETINKQDEDGTAETGRYLDTDNIEDSNISYTELQVHFDTERMNVVMGANYSRERTRQEIPVNTNVDSVMQAVSTEIFGDPQLNIWNPALMALFLGSQDIPVTPDDVIATGDFFYDLVQASGFPGPFVGPGWAGTAWSEIYFNDGVFENYGIFGDVDFQVADRLNLLLGLRYSNDKKTFSWRNPPNTFSELRPGTPDLVFVPNPDYADARTGTLVANNDWNKVTGRAVVQYEFTDSAQAFLSYSTGYKAGGYDSLDVTTSDNPLRPEESENIELGLKGDFLEDRVRLQLALFSMDIEGRQRTVDSRPPEAGQPLPLIITGDQSFDGIEVVLDWLPTNNMRVSLMTTWRDESTNWDPFYNADGELVTETSNNTTDTDYTMVLNWQPEISRGDLDVRVDYIFNEVADDPLFPGFYEDRTELNARVAWASEGDRWTAALWGKNLLDQELLGGISDITVLFGTPFTSMDIGLTWGIELGYRF